MHGHHTKVEELKVKLFLNSAKLILL